MKVSFWSKLPIRSKLLLLTLFSSVMGPLVIAASVILYEASTYRLENLQEVTVIANIVADRSTAALVFGDNNQLQENLASLQLRKTIALACMYDETDLVRASLILDESLNCPAAPVVHEGYYAEEYLHITQQVILDGEPIGKLLIQASLVELRRHLGNFALTALLVCLVTIVAILYVANVLQKRITDPLINLTETASRVAGEKNYELRAELESQDEIGKLVETFNDMLATIEEQNNHILKSNEELEKTVATRTSELLTANKELEAFSYSVSHDLRQPLRAIDGFSEAILEDYGDQLDEMGLSYLQRVRSASQRMGALIQSMLVLSRVTRHVIALKEVNLSESAEAVRQSLTDENPERQVQWSIEPGMVTKGDANLLNIALSNLLQNAWKYSSKEAQAEIRFGVDRSAVPPVFYVSDNGAGFDMKYADKLFVAFSRLHSPDEFEGSGIGLATVNRVINRHHGRIWVESTLNEGTTFYFTLDAEHNAAG